MITIILSAAALFIIYYTFSKVMMRRKWEKLSKIHLSGGWAEGNKYQFGIYVNPKKTAAHCYLCNIDSPPKNLNIDAFKGISVVITIQPLSKNSYIHGIKIYANREGKSYINDAYQYVCSKYSQQSLIYDEKKL